MNESTELEWTRMRELKHAIERTREFQHVINKMKKLEQEKGMMI
jgi:hypothetical protein